MPFRTRSLPGRGLVLAAGALLLLMGASRADAQDAPKPAKSEKGKVAPGSLLVYVDTESLALHVAPGAGRVPLELSADMLNALNTSDEGLTHVTENGVTRIDLQGRYQGVWVAVTDAAGKVKPFCITSLTGEVYNAAKVVRERKEVSR